MSFQHPAERADGGHGPFERMAERASNFTSSPLFSLLCLALVAAFLAVHAAGLTLSWQLLAGDVMTAVTLVLLALLKNTERRAEHAIQRKLDAIAAALLEQRSGHTDKSVQSLDDAIRMEEET
ncbi:low affinity iron permease family protein [Streptacidiphilus jiangxiensis]|uniref:Low affinity Fe/Cu permease n=1 Tax=Streptacidiphilus jiangxiensis TaxID=235985 RepID=A0A1H7W915_STRJI|nr:low affinity iron permease family protein [Streptacidiphilus jiangxiensis]SEM18000.1 Low affinity Fe/Cu permease [Streptacidiphilus jiangxiensis]